jgi:transcriptional regulator with XRE-family HTH domain
VTAVDAAKVLAARKASGYTQAQVARLADVSPRHVRNIEKGHAVPSADVLARIATVLEVSVDSLMSGGKDG